jgi:cell division protein FtsL
MQNEDSRKGEVKTRKISVPFLISLIVLILVTAVFINYWVTASADLSGAYSEISSLNIKLSSANSQVSSLQSQLASADSQVSSLQGQLSSANSQVSSLEEEIASLQSQNSNLQNIVNLSQSLSQQTVTLNQNFGQSSLVATFQADYAGYIVVSGTSTALTGYIRVTDSYGGYPYNNYIYPFGTGTRLVIPVLPGTIEVYFGNTNLSGGVTATINIVYYF